MKHWLGLWILFCSFQHIIPCSAHDISGPEARISSALDGYDFEYTIRDFDRDTVHRVTTRSVRVGTKGMDLTQGTGSALFKRSEVQFENLEPVVTLVEVTIPGTQTKSGLVRIRVNTKKNCPKSVKNSYLAPYRGWFYDEVSYFEFKVGDLALAQKLKSDLLLLIQAAQP